MKRIADERARIDSYKLTVSDAVFFNNRNYKDDLEWLILSYLTSILSCTGQRAPEYAEKLRPPAPDFETYLTPETPFRRIEVTEIFRPDYRRGDFYRKVAKSGQHLSVAPDPHPKPWSGFHRVLHKKLGKEYARNAWLLIYHDMSASEFADSLPWHERILRELRTWTNDSDTTCDITSSLYESIYVIDASGEGAVRLHPHWDLIRETPFPRRPQRLDAAARLPPPPLSASPF